jgi:hypothetical protein
MNPLVFLSTMGKISGDYVPRDNTNKCNINFSEKEKNTILGIYRGKDHTLEDFFNVRTSMPLNTRKDAMTYINWEEQFATKYYKSFKEERYLDEILLAQAARKLLTK